MNKRKIIIEYDPHNHTDEQLEDMVNALGYSYDVKKQEIVRFSEYPPTFVTIVLSFLVGLTLAELTKSFFSEMGKDLYACAKKFVKALVKPKAGDKPTLGVKFMISDVDFIGYAESSNDEKYLLEVMEKIPDLLYVSKTFLEDRDTPTGSKKVQLEYRNSKWEFQNFTLEGGSVYFYENGKWKKKF